MVYIAKTMTPAFRPHAGAARREEERPMKPGPRTAGVRIPASARVEVAVAATAAAARAALAVAVRVAAPDGR